jgi:hypothetical protein
MRAFHRTVSMWHFLSLLAFAMTALQPHIALSATCAVNSASDDTQDATAKVVTVDSAGWAGANQSVVTLRDCIVAANLMTGTFGEPTSPGMNIDLHAIAGQTITLADALPLIFNNLSIDAGNAALVTISGNDAHRIFFVSGLPALANGNVAPMALLTTDRDGARPISVSMQGLIVVHGLAQGGSSNDGGGGMGAGGGLFVNKNASVSLTDVLFSSNRALGGISANGQTAALGGGGMGAGSGGTSGGGLGAPSLINGPGGGGIGGDGGNGSVSGFGGTGLGQISAAQGFDRFQFAVAFGCCNSGGRIGEGGALTRQTAGGFGGGGGAPALLSNATMGGFGGGGGNQAGDGGFGGGGGHDSGALGGGNGGFGGGGGKGAIFNGQGQPAGAGGIGAGTGSDFNQAGGGAAGFGGAVFVRTGASLTIHAVGTSSSISGNTTAGGTGYKNGAAAGTGLFVMSGTNTTFDIGGVATIASDIDDDSNIVLPSGQSFTQGCTAGGDPGCGATISKVGNGTLVTNGRVYAIEISIDAGTIEANGELGYQDILINAGGRLSGTGNPAQVTLGASGILSPGHVTTSGAGGVLNPFQVKWHTQGIGEFRLTSAQATSSTTTVYSMESIPGDSGLRHIRAMIGASTPMIGATYNLVHCTHSCVGSTHFELALSDFALDSASTVRGTLGLSASDLTLTVTQVISDRIFFSGLEY